MIYARFLKLLSVLPLSALYLIADIVSLLLAVIPNRTSRLINQNIQLCFPDLNRKAYKTLCRNTTKQTTCSALELSAVWCWPVAKILDRITSSKISDDYFNSTKARIIIAPHLGCWELLSLWLARECQVTSLFKPHPKDAVNRFILEARSRNGAHLLPVNASGLRQLSKALKQKKTTMILPDQKPRKYRAWAMSDFFGHPAPTTPLIHNLCNRFDCDVFIAVVLRDTDRSEFSIHIDRLDTQILASDQQRSLDYMNKAIENLIRQKPEQYQWGYSRFRKDVLRTNTGDNN